MNESVSLVIIKFFLQTYSTQQVDMVVFYSLLHKVFVQIQTSLHSAKKQKKNNALPQDHLN